MEWEGDYLKAFDCMERALVLRRHFFGADSPEVLHACKALAEMCNLLSMSFLQQVTIDLLKKAEILTKHHPSEKATTLNNLACYYRRLGKLHAAMTCLKRALEIEKKLQNVRNAADTHLNICAVLSQLGKHQNALEQAQEALIILQEEFFQSKQTSPGRQQGKNVGSGDATKKNEDGETPGQQLDRVSVMCIAYHNIGVEQEFLKDYENSVMSYKKRTISTKSAGKRKQMSAGFDSPGKSSTRLLSSPRSSSLTNSLRLPSPLTKERQRHTSSDIPTPRSIVADVLSKGSILPPLDSTSSPSKSNLSPRDPFFSPRFRFNDEVESKSPSSLKKKKKEMKFESPREKIPLSLPNNSAIIIAQSKSPASEMSAENKLQPNGIDDQHKQLSSISVPHSEKPEEARIEVVENEPNEIVQACDALHDAEAGSDEKLPAALVVDQSSNDATVPGSSNVSYDLETEDPEHRDVSTFVEDSSSGIANSSCPPDESSHRDVPHMVVEDNYTSEFATPEYNSSESVVDSIDSNTLVSEDTTAQEIAESGNEIMVNFNSTKPDTAQGEPGCDEAHIHDEESHAVPEKTLDNDYSNGALQHTDGNFVVGDTPGISAAVVEDLTAVNDQLSQAIDPMDATYKEDTLDILEESSQATIVLDYNNESLDADTSPENVAGETAQTGYDSGISTIAIGENALEQTCEVEPSGNIEEETLEENDPNNSASTWPDLDQAASWKEVDNCASTKDDQEQTSELPMDFAANEPGDTVSEDQVVSIPDSLELASDQSTAVDNLFPDNMDNGLAVPENHSQEWIAEPGEHVDSSFGLEGNYTYPYENHEEYTGEGEGYYELYNMGYHVDNAAVESDGYHEEPHADELPADYASTPDQAVHDTNTADDSHEVFASDLTYDGQFGTDVVFNSVVYHDQFEEYYDQREDSLPPPAMDGDAGPHFDPVSEMSTTHVPNEDFYGDANVENPFHEIGTADEEVLSEFTANEAVQSSSHGCESNAVPDEIDPLEGEDQSREPVATDTTMVTETENLSLSNCNVSDAPAQIENSVRQVSHEKEQ
uniref:Uncharacterized protein n=1 Tax=Globisporangium ultimum (strain ATCC 200006 / CBS 805.95 / DAOM BR144) TaxID=431595 RepID=K3WDU7_GLOUD